MNISRTWLQKYFTAELPDTYVIADALTFHAAEVEDIKEDTFDVKVLPDRAAYMLSHQGVAREVASALNLPLKADALNAPLRAYPNTDKIRISIEDTDACSRYMCALVEGVTVSASPSWLKEALESVGQRSINNVVDATNYVMLAMGQPLHAYDANKLEVNGGVYELEVRNAREGEKITVLTGEEYLLPEGTLLIADGNSKLPLGIAGIKGGNVARVDETTTTLLLEAANFEGTRVRRSASALKLFTDASLRFQNRPSPTLVAYGMRDAIDCILMVAGGTLAGVTDNYTKEPDTEAVSVSLSRINSILGSEFTLSEVRSVFEKLECPYSEVEDVFTILPPGVRRDIRIPEDIAEEVGRLLGYDRIPSQGLPLQTTSPNQARFLGVERVKDFLVERGFSEVSTQTFANEGDIVLANPLQADRPWLRASLLGNLETALLRGAAVAPRFLGPEKALRLFEIGNAFTSDGEFLLLAIGVRGIEGNASSEIIKEIVATLEQDVFGEPAHARYSLDGLLVELNLSRLNMEKVGDEYTPVASALTDYRPFSLYPYALRDVAVWTPEGTMETEVANLIVGAAGELLVRIDLFDTFQKEGRVSYAFRLVFESKERTLTENDLGPSMEQITANLTQQKGYEVR